MKGIACWLYAMLIAGGGGAHENAKARESVVVRLNCWTGASSSGSEFRKPWVRLTVTWGEVAFLPGEMRKGGLNVAVNSP